MTSIYEIDQAILALVDHETGEILDWDAFDALQLEREVKIENLACWYKDLMAQAAAIRQEELALAKRRKEIEAKAETRKRWLKSALAGVKFESPRCSISFRKITRVELADEAAAIEWAQKNHRDEILKYAAPTISKDEVAKLLKADVEIPGAALVSDLSMGVK